MQWDNDEQQKGKASAQRAESKEAASHRKQESLLHASIATRPRSSVGVQRAPSEEVREERE